MRIAAIDIGTNTVLLLVADVDDGGGLKPIHHEQRTPRLGRNVDARGEIQAAAFDRIARIMTEYRNLATRLRAERLRAAATSGVRDAANRGDFLAYIRRQTGIDIEILSGEEEAFYTYHGAVSGFPQLPQQQLCVLDIGGGSTELTYQVPERSNGEPALQRYSLPIGAVRLTERFFKAFPPSTGEIEGAQRTIIEELAQVRNPGFSSYTLLGVAGTVTTLASLDQHLPDFDQEKISGYRMGRDRVGMWLARLAALTPGEIRALSASTAGREDVLTAGVLILHEIMSLLDFAEVLVSERGLRYGLVLGAWEEGRSGRR